ncbi:MAG: nitronate monooxygenase [Reyranella sp.]|uniref:NAD(P)H-dependent flavin oxidoreductase n=1 Tax=Reyranella sp. TaxID=1929291 RepID=UPI001AD16ACF|nr:nitronate monooxygenase [Reyranella sp.]MBN9086095.1 nitronate monooxygenase [Reyranella sp.]
MLPVSIRNRLRLPLIAAPMFLVSGPALVIAACRAGVIGSFPTANCRTLSALDAWLAEIKVATEGAAPFCPNLIVHRSNPRLADDLAAVQRAGPEMVITSVGSPEPVMKPLKDAGCLVLADVASVRHAEKAVAAGVDGLVLLTAGAGGQTGWANPFAFVRAVRQFWDGIVVMAGGMADGQAIAAAELLGCDLAYMGTRFIATQESLAKPEYKQMLVASRLDDVKLTRAFTGLETNMLRPSIAAAGLDPDALPERGAIDIAKDIDAAERDRPNSKRWKDIWSAGHSVSGVADVPSVAELVERTAAEYGQAKACVTPPGPR